MLCFIFSQTVCASLCDEELFFMFKVNGSLFPKDKLKEVAATRQFRAWVNVRIGAVNVLQDECVKELRAGKSVAEVKQMAAI